MVEELEPFVEDAVKVVAQDSDITTKIHGKDMLSAGRGAFGAAGRRGFKQADRRQAAGRFRGRLIKSERKPRRFYPSARRPCAPAARTALLLYAINIACRRYQQETGKEPVKTGDIGCYALAANAAAELGRCRHLHGRRLSGWPTDWRMCWTRR